MAPTKLKVRKKIKGVFILLFLCLIVVVGKLGYIQFVQGEDLQLQAENLRTRETPVNPKRGSILDRNGKVLAVSVSADSVSAAPPDVKLAERSQETAAYLAEVLAMDQESILKKITADKSFEWIKRKVTFEQGQKIREADLPGINVLEEVQRFYPKGNLACHVLGFAGIDNQGLDGVELGMDDVLAGTPGSIVTEYDGKNREIPQALHHYVAPVDGNNVVLTLDENLQYFAERQITNLMESTSKPLSASIIMMNPKTGEILAMANSPSFDPNNYADYTTKDYRNPLITDSYEPGSTFKILTMAAALEEGVTSPNDRFYDPGYAMVGKTKIRCWRSYNPHGSETFAEGVQNSCNPVFIEVGLRLEAKEKGLLYKYLNAFGLGVPTGIDLAGESAGIMIAEDKLKNVDIATISMGQSISVTPIQLITAISAVANGGVLLKPQIVRQIVDNDGNVIQDFAVQEVRRVISKETADTCKEILESVVAQGTGRTAYLEGFRIGGKTGTAQMVGPHGYEDGRYIASFLGMAPANDPQVVALVIAREPQGFPYQGGQVAGPIFKALMADTLRYLGVPSQLSSVKDEVTADVVRENVVPDVVNLSAQEAIATLNAAGFKVKNENISGVVTSQSPVGFSRIPAGSGITLKTAENVDNADNLEVTVPDLTGKRLKDAAEILSAMGLKLISNGSGVTVEQSPYPGEKIAKGSKVNVVFSTDSSVNTEEVGP